MRRMATGKCGVAEDGLFQSRRQRRRDRVVRVPPNARTITMRNPKGSKRRASLRPEHDVAAERKAQGLPPTCSDPSVIASIAAQLRGIAPEKRNGKRAQR